MRHVSRTHRVHLDWLFDRINLEKAIHVRYVNTAQQIADVLSWCSLSQERWMQLTPLRGFVTHQTHSCSPYVVFSSCLDKNMWKRAGQMPDERVLAKSKLTRWLCLVKRSDGWQATKKDGHESSMQKEFWKSRTDKIPQATKFGDTTKADHKVLNEDNESPLHHHHAVVVQNSATRWMQSYPCRNKAAQETMRNEQRFLPQASNPGATSTDGSVEFTKECEDLSWNHEKSEPHRSDTNGIAQRAVRWIEEGTSTVFSPIKIGWTTVGWSDGMLFLLYEKVSHNLWRDERKKTPFERRYDTSFRVPMVPFGSEIFYHPFSIKDKNRLHQFSKKVINSIFIGYALNAGGGRRLDGRAARGKCRRIEEQHCFRSPRHSYFHVLTVQWNEQIMVRIIIPPTLVGIGFTGFTWWYLARGMIENAPKPATTSKAATGHRQANPRQTLHAEWQTFVTLRWMMKEFDTVIKKCKKKIGNAYGIHHVQSRKKIR